MPWGPSPHKAHITDGIIAVITASHGGIHLDDIRR